MEQEDRGAGAPVHETSLRLECADYLGELPEPPRSPRSTQLGVQAAEARLLQGRSLLARLGALKQRGVTPLESLEVAVTCAVRLHGHTARGNWKEAEDAWIDARKATEAALSPFRIWEQVSPLQCAFDSVSGTSRYDPCETLTTDLKLQCPSPSCARLGSFRPEKSPAPQLLRCPACSADVWAWFLEALGPPTRIPGGWLLRGKSCAHDVADVVMTDDGETSFAAAEGDLVALLGRRLNDWEQAENLSTGGRFRPRSGGPCFLVSAVYGEQAPQLKAFRAFRDRRLIPHALGRLLVRQYYRFGPTLAAHTRRYGWSRRSAQRVLAWVHWALWMRGYGRD